MNHIAEEIKFYIDSSSMTDEEYLEHYGIQRRSGRYPWGSGEDPYQHSRDFLGRIEELKKTGWTETPENIKNEFGLTTTQYRAQKSLAKDERRMLDVARAKSLKEDGLGATEIGKKMGLPESTVRSLLDSKSEARMMQAKNTADFIREQIEKKGMIDVGVGVEHELNISKEKLNQALAILESEGYPIYKGGIPQVTNKGRQTNQKVICPKGTKHKDIYDFSNVHSLNKYISRDEGYTYEKKFHYPESLDSKRLMIRYKEDGGIDKDGLVELRRGVPDLSLGNSHYSQVRIMVDGKKYIKGMAVYGDDKDFPEGVDVIFNTNKSKSISKMDVLKDIKADPDNPFGSLIKDALQGGQYWYTDKNGNKKLGLINKRADEGDWTDWKDALPSQFLSKQSLSMAKKQLNLAKIDKEDEFDEICSLTNPTVKKHLLSKFADECDSAAVHLQAAALPGQKYHVIIPINSLKDTEVYAPNYENGTKLALIRYPHAGTFEIPILTVNNKNTEAKRILGSDVSDAVGITSKVAGRLSGADFDGDTVMCIPTHDKAGKVKITSFNPPKGNPLKSLEEFNPTDSYGAESVKVDSNGNKHYYRNGREYRIMSEPQKQIQMGVVSNLINDMTLLGAKDDELAAAVRHSMVVIDAVKHKLDYKQSEVDNNISALKKKYQTGGASTLISRSKGQIDVIKRQGSPLINIKGKDWYDPSKPEGSLIYKKAKDAEYQYIKVDKKTGEVIPITKYRTQKSTKMAETSNAYSLVSNAGTAMEMAYAEYANNMKSLANKARMEMISTGKIAYSKSAKAAYLKEVRSLEEKLKAAQLNAPRERQAQLKANAEIYSKVKQAKLNGQELKKDDIKKMSQQALTKYRSEVGSVSRRDRSIKITDREWDAIQAGAISENKLKNILDNTDVDDLRERATPRSVNSLSPAKINRIKAMSASNYTLSEIANKLGISTSSVSRYLKGE